MLEIRHHGEEVVIPAPHQRDMKSVAITGVTGFVGAHLAHAFSNAGWQVSGLSRSGRGTLAQSDLPVHRFDLRDAKRPKLPSVDVLIHCAIDPYRSRDGDAASNNVDGSRRLFTAAREQGIGKIVFISSFAARQTTSSHYGREKFLVEQFLGEHDLILRPGLVVGNGGLFRAMFDSVRRMRCAPLFLGGRQPLYPISVDDLACSTVSLTERDADGTYTLAASTPVPMNELYRALVPLPYAPTLWLVERLERLGLTLPIASGSLRGIPSMRHVDVPSYTGAGLSIRPFATLMSDPHLRAELNA
jgi:nucleoside-diphosphate-sugar epimerase